MAPNRARPTPRARLVAGGLLLAGTAAASAGVAGTAQAAEPALVPDLAPLLTTHNDVQPAPAPEAPPVESSFTAFGPDEPLKQLRDFTPAGVPASGLVEAVVEAPKKITPSGGGGGYGGE
ncbi:hypothetical protein [Pseudonocardia endophytica]|uniref:Uncharacterized protein n=1 Tax=Pseudonocardia endophytica TaxID=401976 RepID=A0A4R1HVV4_PSEEN|nr:hypothetical protein [Pseudonocardia endophytica]TCK25563.1 hypothetical protein EV378_1376 [Pseudonocardia endophytica]